MAASAIRERSLRGSVAAGSPEGGFVLIETLVAMVVLAVVLLATEWGVTGTVVATSAAAEHDVASGLVSSTIAAALAIPFPDLEAGLNPAVDPLSSDPNVTTVVAGGVTSYVLNVDGANIATSNTKTSETPLVPHLSSVTEGTVFHIGTYPTVTASSPGLVTVVVVVTWKPPSGPVTRLIGEVGVSSP